MLNRTIISDWLFSPIDRTQKESILNLIAKCINSSSLPLKLLKFTVPGTLQSNIVRHMDLDPYYERNMEYFQKYEEMILVLFTEVNIEGGKSKVTLIIKGFVAERIGNTAEIVQEFSKIVLEIQITIFGAK